MVGSPRRFRFFVARSRNSLWRNASSQRLFACAMRSRQSAISRFGLHRVATELLGAREREALAGLLLDDQAVAVADDVTRRRVHERRVAERLRERDEVLGAERVRVERLVERRVEVDDAGDVDDRVDGAPRAP